MEKRDSQYEFVKSELSGLNEKLLSADKSFDKHFKECRKNAKKYEFATSGLEKA
jgi:hypothetical protein